MKRVLPLLFVVLLAACGSSQPYSQQDLRDVRHIYSELRPVYLNFQYAYFRNDRAGMATEYAREQRICRQVDVVDRRDTIDPNTNLFAASASLDNFCNDIESAYAGWEKAHHLPYDKTITPSTVRADAFKGGDLSLKKMPAFLRHPASLS